MSNLKFACRYLDGLSVSSKTDAVGCAENLSIRLSNADTCVRATKGDFAPASTDMGHEGGMDAEWGADHAARIRLCLPRAKPSWKRNATLKISTASPPARRPFFTTQNTFYHGWNARTNTGVSSHAILTADKLPILHSAVLEQCDAADGLKVGLISDPVHCQVDVAAVQCHAAQDTSKCLSADQVRVAQEIYRGAHDSLGNQLVISGPLPGSELNWAGVYVPPSGQDRTWAPRRRRAQSNISPPIRIHLRVSDWRILVSTRLTLLPLPDYMVGTMRPTPLIHALIKQSDGITGGRHLANWARCRNGDQRRQRAD